MLQLVTILKESKDDKFAKRGVKICLDCGSSNTCYNHNGIFCKKCGNIRRYEWEKNGYEL